MGDSESDDADTSEEISADDTIHGSTSREDLVGKLNEQKLEKRSTYLRKTPKLQVKLVERKRKKQKQDKMIKRRKIAKVTMLIHQKKSPLTTLFTEAPHAKI